MCQQVIKRAYNRDLGTQSLPSPLHIPKPCTLLTKVCHGKEKRFLKLTLMNNKTIFEVKQFVADKFQVHVEEVIIKSKKRVLFDNQTLSNCGFGSKYVIFCNILQKTSINSLLQTDLSPKVNKFLFSD